MCRPLVAVVDPCALLIVRVPLLETLSDEAGSMFFVVLNESASEKIDPPSSQSIRVVVCCSMHGKNAIVSLIIITHLVDAAHRTIVDRCLERRWPLLESINRSINRSIHRSINISINRSSNQSKNSPISFDCEQSDQARWRLRAQREWIFLNMVD